MDKLSPSHLTPNNTTLILQFTFSWCNYLCRIIGPNTHPYHPCTAHTHGEHWHAILCCDHWNNISSPVLDTVTGPECCGSKINFANNTSPTGAFHRITTGPAFYVPKGKWIYLGLRFMCLFAKLNLRIFQVSAWREIFHLQTEFLISSWCRRMMTILPYLCPGLHPVETMILEKVKYFYCFPRSRVCGFSIWSWSN